MCISIRMQHAKAAEGVRWALEACQAADRALQLCGPAQEVWGSIVTESSMYVTQLVRDQGASTGVCCLPCQLISLSYWHQLSGLHVHLHEINALGNTLAVRRYVAWPGLAVNPEPTPVKPAGWMLCIPDSMSFCSSAHCAAHTVQMSTQMYRSTQPCGTCEASTAASIRNEHTEALCSRMLFNPVCCICCCVLQGTFREQLTSFSCWRTSSCKCHGGQQLAGVPSWRAVRSALAMA